MNKTKRILFCILGSILLVFLRLPVFYEVASSTRYVGDYLVQFLELLSLLGLISTCIFSIMLIIENWAFKK
ncbi:MAG: hypothetical protein ACRCVJ_08070 [Clostridium sp.]|uniref:hypothetical protein n=1 Tax=Clostridium sp. TaxID=1506 RepID=UPI003F2FF972